MLFYCSRAVQVHALRILWLCRRGFRARKAGAFRLGLTSLGRSFCIPGSGMRNCPWECIPRGCPGDGRVFLPQSNCSLSCFRRSPLSLPRTPELLTSCLSSVFQHRGEKQPRVSCDGGTLNPVLEVVIVSPRRGSNLTSPAPEGIVHTFSMPLKGGGPPGSGKRTLAFAYCPGIPLCTLAGRSAVLCPYPVSCLGSHLQQDPCPCPLSPSGSNPGTWFLSAFTLWPAPFGPTPSPRVSWELALPSQKQGAVVKTPPAAEHSA